MALQVRNKIFLGCAAALLTNESYLTAEVASLCGDVWEFW